MVIETSDTVWTKTKQLSSYVSSRVFHTPSVSQEAPSRTTGRTTHQPNRNPSHKETSLSDSNSSAQLLKVKENRITRQTFFLLLLFLI